MHPKIKRINFDHITFFTHKIFTSNRMVSHNFPFENIHLNSMHLNRNANWHDEQIGIKVISFILLSHVHRDQHRINEKNFNSRMCANNRWEKMFITR